MDWFDVNDWLLIPKSFDFCSVSFVCYWKQKLHFTFTPETCIWCLQPANFPYFCAENWLRFDPVLAGKNTALFTGLKQNRVWLQQSNKAARMACMQESHVTLECVIPSEHHRAITGNKWANINDLSQRFSVTIKFPDRKLAPTQSPNQQGLLTCVSVYIENVLV